MHHSAIIDSSCSLVPTLPAIKRRTRRMAINSSDATHKISGGVLIWQWNMDTEWTNPARHIADTLLLWQINVDYSADAKK